MTVSAKTIDSLLAKLDKDELIVFDAVLAAAAGAGDDVEGFGWSEGVAGFALPDMRSRMRGRMVDVLGSQQIVILELEDD